MNRKLSSALATAGAVSAGWAIFATPADAAQRTFVVTLLGGSQVTVTLDVPPETPLEQIQVPGLKLPVENIVEITAPAATPSATPSATPAATPLAAPSATPSATATATPGSDGRPESTGKGKGGQKETRKKAAGDGEITDGGGGATRGDGKRKRRTSGAVTGGPAPQAPGYSLATPGAAPIGVPNFFIDKFRIPPFLLPIYQAAGIQYGVRWEVLAAINEIETDYGRNLNVSSAGAEGWMQFMPATWKMYGTDANDDGVKDPYNPVDAIFAAARYLRAAGADKDIAKAVFAYNHADWYVDSVLLRARLLGGLPSNFVGSLTGLTQGRFPVAARATYADAVDGRKLKRAKRGTNAAVPVESDTRRRSIDVFSKAGAPAVAVTDGKVVGIGRSKALGNFVRLRDAYGNTYTYAELGSVEKLYPAAKPQRISQKDIQEELALPKADKAPDAPATVSDSDATRTLDEVKDALKAPSAAPAPKAAPKAAAPKAVTRTSGAVKERLFANPLRPRSTENGGADQVLAGKAPKGSFETFRASVARVFGVNTKSKDVTLKRLRPGSRVVAGTVLGKLAKGTEAKAAHVRFEIRPAGKGAPRIDPKPILDGWKLLETTEIYRAQGRNPFSGPDAKAASIGQILLMSKEALQRQVLADPRVELYEGGRRDVRLGLIDRRVLATIEFLSLSGLKPTISSLRSNHGFLTASGNVSEHSSGNAVDISAINGIPIIGHQGEGSITDITIQRLLTLQGTMKPHQIISLMTFKDTDNTFSMSDHDDHIHIGFHPLYGGDAKSAKELNATLKPKQWIKLVDRLNEIDNPAVPAEPSDSAIRVAKPEADARPSG